MLLIFSLPGYITTLMTDDDNDRFTIEKKKYTGKRAEGSFFVRCRKGERKKQEKKERKNSYASLLLYEHDNLLTHR